MLFWLCLGKKKSLFRNGNCCGEKVWNLLAELSLNWIVGLVSRGKVVWANIWGTHSSRVWIVWCCSLLSVILLLLTNGKCNFFFGLLVEQKVCWFWVAFMNSLENFDENLMSFIFFKVIPCEWLKKSSVNFEFFFSFLGQFPKNWKSFHFVKIQDFFS